MIDGKLEAALDYAAESVPVFPCIPDGKRPLVPHGFHDATTDPGVIRSWWQRWPEANLATPTGHPGYDVIDIDVHPDGDGYLHMAVLHSRGLLDGWIHTVKTPSGGLHLYFPGTTQRCGKIPTAHIDFRAAGGYVLMPPSTIARADGPGRYETVQSNTEVAKPVDWAKIRAHLTPRRPPARRSTQHAATPPDVLMRRLSARVAEAREGNRNDLLYWATCRIAERGITDPLPLLNAAQQAGLPRREAELTIASAYRNVAALASPTREPLNERGLPRTSAQRAPRP
ncbi:DNA primase [Phytoactinopolyspora alkaliphila]|uniref:DNA primase n=1 Tax=Phytoactinopolyspora alkaliphila TaxID=1783498 RepID=A0A6N9YPI0_9ACTN|nr:bifunctional DNA primase/polymerase [Phytoactinopolyspora alkaliphila]NED96845.1 DNA primase [Phytoactinopolyspora alkaliphila]